MKKPFPLVAILVVIAFAGFSRVAQSPEFGAIRTVDVVQLTGSGVCIGVAMTLMMSLIRRPRV